MKHTLILGLIILQLGYAISVDLKVVCYWPNWRMDEKAPKHHTPEDIDPSLCTHIHHAFHILDEKNNVPKDSEGSVQPDTYKRLQSLKQKNNNLKIILSLGGGGEKDIKYSQMISSIEKRKQFINNTIHYMHKYGFDGLDLDWEYPVCWGGDCKKGPQSDKPNFGHLVQELKAEFVKQTPKLSLSAAVVAGGYVADHSYDFKSMAENMDYINVMTYDGAGDWDHMTGHHSKYQVGIDALKYFVGKGIPKEKLLVGVPFYGHTFTLQDPNKHGIGAPIKGSGHFPSNEGDNALYYEICDMVKNHGWKKERPDAGRDPIAYHGDQWVGYDDPKQAYEKSKWVKDNGYAGVLVWEITQDDFHKTCCSVAYPLLKAVNHGLFGTGADPSTYGCE